MADSSDENTFAAPQVLVVDDDDEFRELLTRQLEAMGCEVQTTSDASEFLAKLSTAKKPYDLAVVDIQLPGLHGDQIISWIRESELSELNTLPVLIVTGGTQGLPASPLDETVMSILFKPYEYSELKATITRMLFRGTRH